MAYQSYLRSVLSGFLLCCLIFILAVFYQLGAPTEEALTIDRKYVSKSNIANSIKTSKLVVVSGSNSHLGISCKIIQTETGVPCVNGGTSAGLGMDYILHRARSWVKPGDIVLLPLEYEHYKPDDPKVSEVLIEYIFACDPKYLLSVDLITQIRFFSGVSFSRLGQGILAKLDPPKQKKEPINEYGDATFNRKSDMSEKQLKSLTRLKPRELEGDIKLPKEIKSITEFVHWCTKNSIKVLATWPNTIWFDVYNGRKQQEFFQKIENFWKALKVPIIGQPRDFMFDKFMFYDTSYHLNDQGVSYRTEKLVGLLKPYLKGNV